MRKKIRDYVQRLLIGFEPEMFYSLSWLSIKCKTFQFLGKTGMRGKINQKHKWKCVSNLGKDMKFKSSNTHSKKEVVNKNKFAFKIGRKGKKLMVRKRESLKLIK